MWRVLFCHVAWSYYPLTSYSPKSAVAHVFVLWYVTKLFQKVFGIIKQLLPLSEGDMMICSPSTGNIALGQYLINKSSCHPHSRTTIVYCHILVGLICVGCFWTTSVFKQLTTNIPTSFLVECWLVDWGLSFNQQLRPYGDATSV